MAKTLTLKVVTPTGLAVEKPVASFTARSTVGEFCVLPDHALILSDIAAGRMIVKLDDNAEETFALDTGFLEAGPEHVHVITDHCVPAGDIDKEAVQAEVDDLKGQLQVDDLDPAARFTLTRRLGWARARLGVAE